MDDKIKDSFNKLPYYFVQTKLDGSFAYLIRRFDNSVDVITRQGNTYPQEFAQKLCNGVPIGSVLICELEVYDNDNLLDRKTGNGWLNSAQQGQVLHNSLKVVATAWDMLTEQEFNLGKSVRNYSDRFDALEIMIACLTNTCPHLTWANTWTVTSMKEAFAIYTGHTSIGKEGVILKSPSSLWKNGTAKDIVKLKIKFEAEYRVIGVIEGQGKNVGKVGALMIETYDKELVCNVGTGISDKQRKDWFDDPTLIVNKIATIEANDIIQSRDVRKPPSLSLPVFIEIRTDKNVADTYDYVVAQLEAAKAGL